VQDPSGDASYRVPLVVIPCLNEAAHLEALVSGLQRAVARWRGRIAIVDGGSTDGTLSIAAALAFRHPHVHLLRNPARLQSAGINAAVKAFGRGHTDLIRIDAHASYPSDYIDVLLSEAERTGAASVTVGMIAEGDGFLQRLTARTQNAKLGNGGSAHRAQGSGKWVDHGHHALMRLDAFEAVGGYDAAFSHNEDAELDYRLRAAGHRIWLTGKTAIGYFPRDTVQGLSRQYFNYGQGRAKNLLKHHAVPRLRQAAMIAVLPAMILALCFPIAPLAALPMLLWLSAALAAGLSLAITVRAPDLMLATPLAIVMHVSWSAGFWYRLALHCQTKLQARPA